ncbi:MAG: hypothetical protein HFE73_04370 [Firmicutes bacterium]|nr:hypothetical protein [Bacillota bacterium]
MLWIVEHILLICLSLATIAGCGWLWMFRARLRLSVPLIPIMSLLNTAAGLICVKLFAGLEAWGNPLESGQSLFGSVFLLPILYVIGAKISRRQIQDVFDIFAMCTITTLVFARVACIVSGCCLGEFLPGSETLRWPTRELEILFHLGLLVFFCLESKEEKHIGEIWPLYMMTYGIFRFVEEWFRAGDGVIGPFHYGHIWAILSIVIGSSIYIELREQKRRTTNKEKFRKRLK